LHFAGCVVLQMNFRGSAGYGAEFEAAGNHEWGGKMQDDVTDGVQTLISMGVADPNRICIAGISYGGYAALMGAVKTPNLYKCAIGTNGVYDLRDMIRSEFNYIGGRSQLGTAHIGQYSEKEFLAKASPRKRASEIKIPILLIASDDDRTVRPKQSKDMASALKRNKVDYEFIELENGGHGMRTTESRLTYMEAVDKFLAKHLH
jgi:dipeptidyl aminopeptidase/acylaminoacyl peptidase